MDLAAVDAAPVLSLTPPSGSIKKTFPASPHKVGLSREIVPEERGPKDETKREIEDQKSFTKKSGANSKQDEKQNRGRLKIARRKSEKTTEKREE
jgi:hypothetical protein